MTTDDPLPAWPGRFREAWHGLRRWRRVRPFRGGLLTVLEIFGTTQRSLGSPTLSAVPLPAEPTSAEAAGPVEPVRADAELVSAAVAPAVPTVAVPAGTRPANAMPAAESMQCDARPRDLRPYVVLPVLLGLAAAMALAATGPTPVRAVAPPTPACPTTAPGQGGTQPAPSGTPGGTRPAPSGTPGATPAPSGTPGGTRPAPSGTPGALPAPAGTPGATPSPTAPGPFPSTGGGRDAARDILDGIGDLVDRGRHDEEVARRATPSTAPSVRPTAAPSVRPTAAPSVRPTATATGRPAAPGRGCAPASPKPSRPGQVVAGRPLPRIAADPGQPVVAAVPSKLTGSKVTMDGLRFEGVVDLPTADGSLKALKFTMDRAVTDDFLLRAPAPGGRTMRFATDRLTVQGDVAFYATRFVGRLVGVRITLTPDLPFPDGLPITSPVPITFTEPAMELAFVNSDTLTARPALKLTLS
ncbi:hypothetical protein RM555_28275 [Micromonospora sp. DSM 115977]|uniref:Uncharacterized protein n=1 Tax=Micromonospora reichwaldensis TaxID=3075516 RepID=A0ABU2X4W9_9ACTN|nr:hypothetical protein [Micromonospora sp. DSM 115977]MDT0532899.1 hypothetical protein [Micromonospora sp. DSM 115977]